MGNCLFLTGACCCAEQVCKCCRSSEDTSDDYDDSGFKGKLRKLIPSRLNITRIAYSLFLIVGFIVALCLRDGLYGLLEKIPVLNEGCKFAEKNVAMTCLGIHSAYRISASLVIFYLINCFLASRLFCVGDKVRLYIQHKWFIIKVFIWPIILIPMFFIPNDVFIVYAWIALFMSLLFIIIQVVLLIDFSYSWEESWKKEDEDDPYTIWDYLILVCAFLMLIFSIGFVVAQFIVFGSGASCHLNRVIISVSVVLGIIAVIGSIIARRGILPPSVIVFFASFMGWSALSSDSTQVCNRLITATGQTLWSQIFSIVFSVLFAAFSLVRVAITTGSSFKNLFSGRKDEEEPDEEQQLRIECSELFYTHIVYMFASFYLAMMLTSWDINNGSSSKFVVENGVAAYWVKVASQWFTYIVFFWSLISPKILGRCRDFD
jgi:hypothetical protein